jgi:SNF2 family DNA or RNA helicase
LIQKAWTGKKIISPVAKPYFDEIFLREFKADLNARRTAEYRDSAKVPTSEWFTAQDEKLKALGIELNPYQRVASFNACNSKMYGLFCDPGTGKTVMMIRKLDHVIDHTDRETLTIILCPKNIRTNWRCELERFSTHTDSLFVTNLQGGNPTQRAINFMQDMLSPEAHGKHKVLICGYEAFVQTPRLHELEFDLCLLDESQNIANSGTKRAKTLLANRSKFENVVIATGTPFRNSPFDIFSQFEFLGEGISGFESLNAFKLFYGNYSNGYNGRISLDGFKNIPLLTEKIAKYCFVIRKEEALPFLPKKTFHVEQTEMTKEQDQVYMDLASKLYSEIESYGADIDAVTVNNILTKLLRLAQITSGYVVMDSGAVNRFDPNPKMELLIKYLIDGDTDDETEFEGTLTDPNSKSIIWCAFKHNISVIRARLEIEGIKCVTFHGDLDTDQRDEAVRLFNCDPSTRVFLGTAASGGVGLNLIGFDSSNPDKYTTNCNNIIYFSNNWSYVQYAQSQDRAHRYNTRVPIKITNLVISDSIDEEILSRLKYKKDLDLQLQDVRAILTSILNRK